MDRVDGSTTWRPLERIERLWLAHRFAEVIARRQDEPVLLNKVCECVEKLRRNPQQPGLHLEQIDSVGECRIFSARIDQQYRLILAALKNTEVGLLYFANHDEAYRWVDQNRSQISRLLQRRRELPPGIKPTDPLPSVAVDDADPLWIADVEALRRMIARGMANYLAYLDEHQAYLAELDMTQLKGPTTLVKGGAGTGKTALAIARLRHLAARPEMGYGPVLYVCYNRSLREAVVQILDAQYGGRYPRDQIQVENIHAWCRHYLESRGIPVDPDTTPNVLNYRVRRALDALPDMRERLGALSIQDIADEIRYVLRPNNFAEDQKYLNLHRKGAKFSLRQAQRRAIWEVYQAIRADRSRMEFDDLPELTLEILQADGGFLPYRGVVVDEGQDFSPVLMRLAKAVVGGDARRLYVLADTAQGIYPSGFFWTQQELGVQGGQIHILRKSYRSTRQIKQLADSLYARDDEIRSDLDELYTADRLGPVPELLVHFREEDEARSLERIQADLSEPKADGSRWQPDQIAVLALEWRIVERLAIQLQQAGLPVTLLDRQSRRVVLAEPTVKLLTIHAAKGLDFPVVYLCGLYRPRGEAVPSAARRALFYVGMTRAAHKLTLSTVFRQADPLLYELDPSSYALSGDAALQFIQVRDALSSSGA